MAVLRVPDPGVRATPLLRSLLCIAAATAAGTAPPAARAQSTPFVLTSTDWEDRSTGSAVVEWHANAATVAIPADRAGLGWVRARTPLLGDFDAQVSYALETWDAPAGTALSMGFLASTPETGDRAARQILRVGRLWADAVDQYDARVLKSGEWRERSSAIETGSAGRLRILRRLGQVHASVRVEGGWETLQIFDLPSSEPLDLVLTAANGTDAQRVFPPVRVTFSDLRVEQLPGRAGGAGAGAPGGVAGGEQDWLVAANDAGWLRVMSRAQFKAPQAANQEILGGSGERILAKTELQGGFATRDEALAFLCARITRVVVDYNPVRTPKEIVRATFGDTGYYLHLEGGTDPEALRPADNYDVSAEKGILRTHGITPRAAYRKLWLVHATGHGTIQGPVKDDAWMTIPSEPVPDTKNPAVASFVIPDGMGGTFTYSCDRWEGPYRDNFGLARAMQRLGAAEVAIYPPANAYVRTLVAAEVPESPRDFGAEVLGLQPIVDSGELHEWQVYVTGDVWLHIGTRTEFEAPVKQRETLLAGQGDAVMKRESIPLGRRFVSYDDALDALVPKLTGLRTMVAPLSSPPEIAVGEVAGRKVLLHLARSPDALVAGYGAYDLGAEMRLLASKGKAVRRTFKPQWLVHATGHGTYSGPVKDDLWMMVSSQPKDGGVTMPDGMGGTFGYSVDQFAGPFTDSFELARELKARSIPAIGLVGEDRRISADEADVATPPERPAEPPRILSIAPERGEAGETFYITVIATGVKQGYRFSFGRGVTVRDETWLGRNPDGPGERWLATVSIDKDARFDGRD